MKHFFLSDIRSPSPFSRTRQQSKQRHASPVFCGVSHFQCDFGSFGCLGPSGQECSAPQSVIAACSARLGNGRTEHHYIILVIFTPKPTRTGHLLLCSRFSYFCPLTVATVLVVKNHRSCWNCRSICRRHSKCGPSSSTPTTTPRFPCCRPDARLKQWG